MRQHGLVAALGALTLIIAILAGPLIIRSSERVETISVVDRDRTSVDGSSDARLYLDNGDVYRVGDSWSYLHFNSSNVWAQLEPGGTYEVKVIAWRVPLFSLFPNIIEVLDEHRDG